MKKLMGIFLSMIMLISIFPSAYAQSEAYTVDRIYFSDLAGNSLENPTKSCLVNIDVTKTADSLGQDIMVIATYSTDGAMIGFTTVAGTMDKGETDTYSTLVISPNSKNVGVVKAYVWNNISEMKPISKVNQVIVNQLDESIELPPVTDAPIAEKYIPDVITCTGTITGTSRISALDSAEFYIEGLHLIEDYSNCSTDEEYTAMKTRNTKIAEEYGIDCGNTYNNTNYKVISEVDLYDYIFNKMKLEITRNKNGDYVVIGAEPDTDNAGIQEINAEEYVKSMDANGNSLETNNKIKFGSKAYTMATAVDLYVNGAYFATVNADVYSNSSMVGTMAGASDTMLDKFLGNAQGTVSLVKMDGDTGYSKILLTYYDVAKVASVVTRNNATTIQFNTADNSITAMRKLTINNNSVEDDSIDLKVSMNSKEIGISEIKKGDIIAFATDMAAYMVSSDVIDPEFITILVSRDTASGRYTKIDNEKRTFTIDGKEYKMAQSWNPNYLSIGDSYTLYLDPFGRIYAAEVIETDTKYAIVEKYTSDDKVRLVLSDGTVADYDTTLSKAQVEALYMDGNDTKAVTDRVVEYVYKESTNEITAMTAVTGIAINAEYRERTNRLGSTAIAESTKVIDASEYVNGSMKTDEYSVFNVSQFKDGKHYQGVAFKNVGSSKANFIVLTYVDNTFDSDSRFAVARNAAEAAIVGNDDCYTMNVLADGVEKTLTFDTAFDTETGRISTLAALNAWLAQGDAFYYTLNSDGRVDAAYKVLDFTKYNKGTHTWSNVFNSSALSTAIKAADWNFNYYDNGKDIQLIYGIVTDVNSKYITFAQINSGVIDKNNEMCSAYDTTGTATFGITNDTVYYVYDQFAVGKESEKIYATDTVWASNLDLFETAQNSFVYDNDVCPYENINDYLTYAMAMVVDGVIVEIYSFVN